MRRPPAGAPKRQPGVSILTPSEKRMRPGPGARADPGLCVSILTPSEKRMRRAALELAGLDGQVSILTPSEKRMRRPGSPRSYRRSARFNPHPLREEDAPWSTRMILGAFTSFNPHPLREEDAPRGKVEDPGSRVLVSILTPSEKRMRRDAEGPGVGGLPVSILTPSEKRMRLGPGPENCQ